MPGAILRGMSYTDWARRRKSVLSNAIVRRVYFNAFGYGPEDAADRKTHMLSLSDCYWIKYVNEDIAFEDLNPYYKDFWDGAGAYDGSAIPTLYTSEGSEQILSRQWKTLQKRLRSGAGSIQACYRSRHPMQ